MQAAKPFAQPGTPARWIRPRHFRIEHLDLSVRIDLEDRSVSGSATHSVVWIPHAPRRTLILDQVGLVIAGVTIDGRPVEHSTLGHQLSIAVPDQCPDRIQVAVGFSVQAPAKGLHFVAADQGKGRVAMAWTQGAMEDHHHWFPCFDDPNNLSTYRIAMTRRKGLAAIANGDHVSDRDLDGEWTETVYEQRKPHVLYLLNVVVGDLVAVDSAPATLADGRRIPVRHWLPRGEESKAGHLFRATAFAIEWLSRTIGVPYAWSRYGHVVVHGFMWGGMENTTLTTITDRVLIDAATAGAEDVDADHLVIHELVHQWFGDLLTMKSWSDIWLNESFATWLEARGTAAWRAHHGGESETEVLSLLLWGKREAYLEQESTRYRRALVTNRWDDAYELFDCVAYEKGSLVLEHLAQVLGPARMSAALTLYTSRHAHDLVETDDLRQAVEDATGDPLDWFFHQWLHREGHPTLKVRCTHDAGRGHLVVEVTQVGLDGEDPWRLPTSIAWSVGGKIDRRPVELTKAAESLILPCPGAPDWVALDPEGTLPVAWDEEAEEIALVARASDDRLGAAARARACVAAGRKAPSRILEEGLSGLVGGKPVPELVRLQAIAALGELRNERSLRALLTVYPTLVAPRLRRAVAKVLGSFSHLTGETKGAVVAEQLVALADQETSLLTAGELLAARGALEHPGAVPILRARMVRPSWNDRLAIGCIRGLGASGEAAAIDDLLPILHDRRRRDAVRQAACSAVAHLGARFLLARDRVRRALESLLDDDAMAVRSAAAESLADLGDPSARGILSRRREREVYGNVRRVLREAIQSLDRTDAVTVATADLARRLETVQAEHADLKRRMEAVERRLG